MDKTEIINTALSHLGADTIHDIDEGSPEANAAKQYYDIARRSALRDGVNWGFATKIERLALLDEQPVDFAYAYALPSDYIRVINIVPKTESYSADGNIYPFKVRSGKLVCDLEEVYAAYIFNETDTNNFDTLFIDAFSYLLASKMAIRVASSKDLMQINLQLFHDLISTAGASSTNENKSPKVANPYVDARW